MLCLPDLLVCFSCTWMPFCRLWSCEKIEKAKIELAVDGEELERRSGGTLHTHEDAS